jgi:hypothetical protein
MITKYILARLAEFDDLRTKVLLENDDTPKGKQE